MTALASVALAAILTLAGCNGRQPQPVADNRSADESAIGQLDADWVKAAQTRQADAWVAFYSDDAVVLPPNDKIATDKAAIHKVISDMFTLPNISVTWRPTKVEAARSGDIAYLYGAYELTFTGPDGKPVSDRGKNIEIWKKQGDGNWKCAVDTWNSDLPAAPTAPAR